MNINYQLTEADIEQFYLYRPRYSDAEKRRRRFTNWIISILYVVVGLLIMLFDSENLISITVGAITILIGLLLMFFYDRYFYWRLKRNTRRMLREASNEGLLGKYQLTLSEGGVTIQSPIGSISYTGDFVVRVAEDDDLIYCYTSSIAAELIPKRAFKSEYELETFRRAIEKFVAPGE